MFKFIRIYDVEFNNNEVLSGQYEVIQELDTFTLSEDTENKLLEICKKKNLPYSVEGNDYAVVKYIDEQPVAVEGYLYYSAPDEEIESYLDCADWDRRCVVSAALNEDLTIGRDYKLINNVTDEAYIQWICSFVRAVIYKAKLSCKEVVIDDIEWSKRLFLHIDGHEYTIRTWSFIPCENDEKGHTCGETVSYTLYKIVKDEKSSHGEEISEGICNINWKNE